MSISIKVKEILDHAGAVYTMPAHPEGASDSAMVRTWIVNADGLMRIAMLPEDRIPDLKHMKVITRCENIRLATTEELVSAFPDCDPDAIPPLGDLFGLPVYCDVQVADHGVVEFRTGARDNTVRMDFKEFKRVVNPTVTDIVDHQPAHAA
jgi:Ala-tRNA(Pro) deacylase